MISIIIPVYNEEESIGILISYLKQYSHSEEIEIIVVDGGSNDNTVEVAKKHGAQTIISPEKGRAKQMNYGAQKARGDWLYFLHADTFPPQSFTKDIAAKIKEGFECGCFLLGFDSDHPALQFFSWFTRFDLNIFRFGDQSLFAKKALFCQLNGFNEKLMVMEDQEIVQRLKKHAQFGIIKKAVRTSARKYQRFGVFRLQLIFSIIVVLYYLKVSQRTLAHFYKTSMSGSPY
ncbi:MAG: TIGR04283 family arsenosugar biosynthesis glycosyltransferase [Balneolaceae bacterium]